MHRCPLNTHSRINSSNEEPRLIFTSAGKAANVSVSCSASVYCVGYTKRPEMALSINTCGGKRLGGVSLLTKECVSKYVTALSGVTYSRACVSVAHETAKFIVEFEQDLHRLESVAAVAQHWQQHLVDVCIDAVEVEIVSNDAELECCSNVVAIVVVCFAVVTGDTERTSDVVAVVTILLLTNAIVLGIIFVDVVLLAFGSADPMVKYPSFHSVAIGAALVDIIQTGVAAAAIVDVNVGVCDAVA